MKLILHTAFFIFSLFLMLSRNIAPKYFWPVGMLVQLIPLLWIINIILLLIMILKKSRFFYFPLFIIIILSIFFFNSTFQLRNTEKSTASNSISVISYNASFFKKKTTFSKEYYDPLLNAAALEINNWLVLNEADVICVQEFFDDVNSDILNNIATITASGKYEYHFVYKQKHDNGIRQGLVIFSKYPIIDKGTVFISENNYNGAIYTDLKIKNDTVRIIDPFCALYSVFVLKEVFCVSILILRTFPVRPAANAGQG